MVKLVRDNKYMQMHHIPENLLKKNVKFSSYAS